MLRFKVNKELWLTGLGVMSLLVMGCLNWSTERLKVATTSSLYDAGLWHYLEPIFEKKYNIELDIIYTGTGIALEWGRRGDIDILITHCKLREEEFVASGYGVERVPFAYNYFLIIGPPNDPAGIKGLSPQIAFKRLMETRTTRFVSRGDDSGTHTKEKIIWEQAGYDYEMVRKAGDWYIESGKGMGSTLLLANEKQAYTLTDRATFLTYRNQLNLVPIVDKGEILLNVYSAIAINPKKHPKTKIDMANNLIDFLTSPETQKLISNYGFEEYGVQLFYPVVNFTN